jgi:hypothetical protein
VGALRIHPDLGQRGTGGDQIVSGQLVLQGGTVDLELCHRDARLAPADE